MTEAQLQTARLTNDIRPFLKEYFLFRAQVTFKNRKKIHLYGHEHQCTYNQVKNCRVETIQMDAIKGYTDLIKYIESKAKVGVLIAAKIYSRNNTGEDFNTLHRSFFNNEWEQINDPQLLADPAACIRQLNYQIINNNIVIKNPEHADAEAFFKAEVDKAFSK